MATMVDFSLTRGGPLFTLLSRTGIVRPGPRPVIFGPRTLVIVAVAVARPRVPLPAINQPIPELRAKLAHAVLGAVPP
jgi:hypothetical protein